MPLYLIVSVREVHTRITTVNFKSLYKSEPQSPINLKPDLNRGNYLENMESKVIIDLFAMLDLKY